MAESPIQSSFIPRDAAAPAPVPVRRYNGGGLSDLLLLVSIVLFVASLALAGAVFLYDQYVQTSAASKLEQLKRAKEAFEPSLIHQITRLDDRMRAAEQVLGIHIAPTAFFLALEQSTLQSIAFQTLDFDAADPQRISISMTGIAASVNAIALQGDLFSKGGIVTNPIFSDINRQPDGVHFKLTALLNPAAVNYVQLVAGLIQQAATAPVQNQPFGPDAQPAVQAPVPPPEQSPAPPPEQ